MHDVRKPYNDLHDHLAELKKKNLLVEVDRPIDKDSELHPLVRWQFVGGMKEADRKAFLFKNIVDGKGRKYDIPVVVGALAANRRDLQRRHGLSRWRTSRRKWDKAIANPIPPTVVENAPCHEIVEQGDDLKKEGHGLDRSADPGVDAGLRQRADLDRDQRHYQGPGNRRAEHGHLPRRAEGAGPAGGAHGHPRRRRRRLSALPQRTRRAATARCRAPSCSAARLMSRSSVRRSCRSTWTSSHVAGGLAGAPIRVVKAKTVDLMVPAEAEVVIEGYVDTEMVEPEAPFGESHGHVALEEYNMPMRTHGYHAAQRCGDPVLSSARWRRANRA